MTPARILAAIFALCIGFAAHAATLLPPGKQTFWDANGKPLSGGIVSFYVPGTTTPKNTWQDSGSTILNSNPVILNGSGQAVIYGSGAYRQIVKDSLGNTIWDQVTSDTSASGTSWSGTSGGTANAQTVSAANFTSADGQSIGFIAGVSNTNAATLNVNGAGALSILKDTSAGPVTLTGGEIVAGNLVQVVYSSTTGAFHLVNYPDSTAAFADLASATTTNLSTVASRNVNVTGTATITSLGSSASTSFPIYNLRFTGAATLTHNATSLILPGGANIVTAANDTARAIYLGSGNWLVTGYTRANGKAIVETDQFPTQTGNAGYQLTTSGTAAAWSNVSVVRSRASATSAATPVVTGAVNVASVTRTGTGTFDVVFTTAMATAAYQAVVTPVYGSNTISTNLTSKSTTGFTVVFAVSTVGLVNPVSFDFVVFGGY